MARLWSSPTSSSSIIGADAAGLRGHVLGKAGAGVTPEKIRRWPTADVHGAGGQWDGMRDFEI